MDQPESPHDLNTFEGVVADILDRLTEQSKAVLRSTPANELIGFHHGWGTGIRNHYRLWSNETLLASCAARAGYGDFIHPDSASSLIIRAVWEAVNAQK
jgi:hypothetical protein